MLIYLFGLSGAGKNFVGRVLQDTYGFTFYDGDWDLTEEMREAVRQQRPFTEQMRDDYYVLIIRRLAELQAQTHFLAFGQATFKERHRQQILATHPRTNFVWVRSELAQRMARLGRGGSPVTAEYARRIDQYFEPPQQPALTIVNNGTRSDVATQCLDLLGTLVGTGRA